MVGGAETLSVVAGCGAVAEAVGVVAEVGASLTGVEVAELIEGGFVMERGSAKDELAVDEVVNGGVRPRRVRTRRGAVVIGVGAIVV